MQQALPLACKHSQTRPLHAVRRPQIRPDSSLQTPLRSLTGRARSSIKSTATSRTCVRPLMPAATSHSMGLLFRRTAVIDMGCNVLADPHGCQGGEEPAEVYAALLLLLYFFVLLRVRPRRGAGCAASAPRQRVRASHPEPGFRRRELGASLLSRQLIKYDAMQEGHGSSDGCRNCRNGATPPGSHKWERAGTMNLISWSAQSRCPKCEK